MNKKEIFDVLYEKEKSDAWKKYLKIKNTIIDSNELYNYFDDFVQMLSNKKSYIKLRGFRLICRLSKWDDCDKIEKVIDQLLNVLDDDKPTIVRQCLDILNYLLAYKPDLVIQTKAKILSLELSKYKESTRPLIERDIDKLLKQF